jgi:hypothetical protein
VTEPVVHAYFRHGHGNDPVVLASAEDANKLVDDLLTEPFDNSVATLYHRARPATEFGFPDHELTIAVAADDHVGGVRYMGEYHGVPGTWFSKGATSEYDEVVYYYMGHDREYPRDSEVSLDAVRQAVRDFLLSGGQRPSAVEWQEA